MTAHAELKDAQDTSFRDSSTILTQLSMHATLKPQAPLFSFLRDDHLTTFGFGQVQRRVAGAAAAIARVCVPGDRAVLLFPHGVEFIVGFLACLQAGVIPAPLYPPSRNVRSADTIAAVLADCGARAVLTSSDQIDVIRERLHGKVDRSLRWLCIDECGEGPADMPRARPEDTAFLQYTSGSTGTPKGVVVSHRNLSNNIAALAQASGFDEQSIGVSWLPPYHDMGLIGGVLMPLAIGFHTALLSPTAFLQRPVRWLQAITDLRATGTGAPNFAYDACLSKIRDEDLRGLDLSSLRVAYNGAEPISADTIERFSERFAAVGFRRDAFFPCYGMAEATLFVSGGLKSGGPDVIAFEREKLATGMAQATDGPGRPLVSCGVTWGGNRVEIVDPNTDEVLGDGELGEIWINGPTVTQGYWGSEDLTAHAFGARLNGEQGDWMRSGDLGFKHRGQLFISGRRKDLIIIRGRNYHPQDIERVAQEASDAFEPNGGAAVSIHTSDREHLVIIQELRRSALRSEDFSALTGAIRRAVSESFELQTQAVVLLKPGALPRTTSGKVRRSQAAQDYVNGDLAAVYTWRVGEDALPRADTATLAATAEPSLVGSWLRENCAQALGVSVDALDIQRPLRDYGLDSFQAATISGDFTDRFGPEIGPEVFDRCESVAELASYLDQLCSARNLFLAFNAQEREAFLQSLDRTPELNDFFGGQEIPPAVSDLSQLPEVEEFGQRLALLRSSGGVSPYFSVHDGVDDSHVVIEGRDLLNFSSNNFLGLSGHPLVLEAAKSALDQYGASVSASRLIAGERPLHNELERELAEWVGTEDAMVYVAANLANVSTVGHLYGPEDLILYDELSHNSLLQGARLSHARAIPFAHNDVGHLERLLQAQRRRHRRVLIYVEGLYSMDGDLAPLPDLVDLKTAHGAHLMVDECLSIGVVGATGRGVGEHFNIDPRRVELWMGGISKAFASCGGYIAGDRRLIEYLRYSAPGFIYTTGITPANAAAALGALSVLRDGPARLEALRANVRLFLDLAKARGLDTGSCRGDGAIVPIIVGDQLKCLALFRDLQAEGINVTPIFYPAVAADSARLRFSISPTHTRGEIEAAIDSVVAGLQRLGAS